MAGSNRAAGVRGILDKSKNHLLNLPVETRRVKRRVKSDQVSSYSLRVHSRPNTVKTDQSLLMSRNVDPGEGELEGLSGQYRPFLTDSAKNRPKVLIDSILHRIGDDKIKAAAGALLGQFVNLGDSDNFSRLISQMHTSDRKSILARLGRSTWREIVRQPELRNMHSLFSGDAQFIGELALNANTIYRQGTDVLRLVLPYADDVLRGIDYADIGDQQVFNTRSPNLLPSNVYPTDSYGINELRIGGPKSSVTWVHSTPPKTTRLLEQIEEQLNVSLDNKGKLTAHPMGFLPKYHSQALTMTPDGLRNSTVHIPLESVNRVLAGFVLYSVKGESLFVNPPIGTHQLSPDESKLRQKMFSLTSKQPTNIIKQIKERGDSGYGDREIDIYNEGQYVWSRGKRSRATDDALLNSLFPHPLLRKVSTDYRDATTDPTVCDQLCSLTLATLPMTRK